MTMDPQSTLPPWREVRAAVGRYDEARLREAVDAALAAGPADAQAALQDVIAAVAGAWYGRSGWYAGNESFGSCWCHSPVAGLGDARGDRARRAPAVDWVVGEVNAMVACLRAVAAVYDGVARDAQGRPDAAAVADALDRLIDLMIERTSCQESWYRYAADAATWLCDHLGVPRDAIEPVVEASIDTVFSSWTEPAPGPRRAAVRSIGEVITATGREPPEAVVARAERLLRPRRERLAECLAAAEGLDAGAAAEALVARGLLHESWLDPARRAFTTFDAKARLAPPRERAHDAAVYALLAADPEGVARAEALALELAHRLRPYGLGRAPTRIVWLLERDVAGYGYRRFLASHEAFERAAGAAGALSGAADPRLDVSAWASAMRSALPEEVDALGLRARCVNAASEVQAAVNARRAKLGYEAAALARLWSASLWWSTLRDAGARVPDGAALPLGGRHSLAGVGPEGAPLRALPDPLAALMALWDTGYALHALDAKEGTLTLLIPKP